MLNVFGEFILEKNGSSVLDFLTVLTIMKGLYGP